MADGKKEPHMIFVDSGIGESKDSWESGITNLKWLIPESGNLRKQELGITNVKMLIPESGNHSIRVNQESQI